MVPHACTLQEFNEVVLIAHSFGCCLAARLAASLRKKVAALILIGAFYPIGGSDRIGPPWIMRLPSWVSHIRIFGHLHALRAK